jgi:xanthosine utilization system XapX-like protein
MGLISGIAGVTTAVIDGIMAGEKAKEKTKRATSGLARNDSWFNNERYKDILNTDSNREALKNLSNQIEQNQRELGAQANIMGTNASVLTQQKAKENQNYADAIGAIQTAGEQEKDAVVSKFIQRNNDLANQLSAAEEQKQEAIGSAISGVIGGAASIADPFVGIGG